MVVNDRNELMNIDYDDEDTIFTKSDKKIELNVSDELAIEDIDNPKIHIEENHFNHINSGNNKIIESIDSDVLSFEETVENKSLENNDDVVVIQDTLIENNDTTIENSELSNKNESSQLNKSQEIEDQLETYDEEQQEESP